MLELLVPPVVSHRIVSGLQKTYVMHHVPVREGEDVTFVCSVRAVVVNVFRIEKSKDAVLLFFTLRV